MPIDASKYGIPVQKATGTVGTIDVLKYGTPVTPAQSTVPQKTTSEKIANTTNTLFGGKQIGEAIGTLSARSTTRQGTGIKTADYSKLTPEAKARLTAQGVPTTREAQLEETAQGIKGPSAQAIVGDVGRIALNFIPIGKAGALARGGEALTTGKKVYQAAKIGTQSGALMGASDAMREDGSIVDIVKGSAIGAGVGGVFGGAIGLAGAGVSKLNKKFNVANAIDELEGKYTEWSTGTKPGKKLVQGLERKTDALNQAGTAGKTPMRGLAEKGIVPEIQGTKFNTFEQAQNYRSTVAPLRETNREALQEIVYSTPQLKLSDLEQKAIAYARTPQNINSGRFDSMYKDIRKEFGLLKEHYPSGEIPITVVDDIKSARWDNVFKNKSLIEADVLKKDSEYAIAKSLQKSIEESAIKGGHTDIAQLNREIGDILEQAKFLESLDGKVLKGGRVGKYVGTLVGASLGQTIPGKIIGAVGGNVAADLLIKSSVQSPIRRLILSKLKATDPAAYSATIKWLAEQDALRVARPRLNAPSPLGTSKNPIITPAPTTYEKPARNIRRYDSSIQSKSPNNQQTNPAITNVTINPISKTIQRIKNTGNKEGGFVATSVPFKNEGNLTTKILKDLEGKTTVSKQYILDATNRGELKQVERDITRQILDTMPDGQINVKEFADKVKSELLPLNVRNQPKTVAQAKSDLKKMGYTIEREMDGGVSILDKNGDYIEYDEMSGNARKLVDRVFGTAETYDQVGGYKYENISLPDELKGNVKNYRENIYESPIKTSAGSTHFSGQTDNYFGHTRIEDMADNKTRRVIEVQSDLYQKGNLEREKGFGDIISKTKRDKEISKLQQYNDPTAHFRMIREEIRKAAQDGKTKLQFPTGETAMKIEGLGETHNWAIENPKGGWNTAKPENLKVGMEIREDTGGMSHWIITDVLGDGKFKAVPKDKWDNMDAGVFLYSGEEKRLNELWGKNQSTLTQAEKAERDALFAKADQLKETYQFNREIPDTETFDISGKVDTNNPIYKFYEKDVQKYLNKFGGKRIVDDKGVSWIEIPITKEQGKAPVDAFGRIKMNPLMVIAGATAVATYGAGKLAKKK